MNLKCFVYFFSVFALCFVLTKLLSCHMQLPSSMLALTAPDTWPWLALLLSLSAKLPYWVSVCLGINVVSPLVVKSGSSYSQWLSHHSLMWISLFLFLQSKVSHNRLKYVLAMYLQRWVWSFLVSPVFISNISLTPL